MSAPIIPTTYFLDRLAADLKTLRATTSKQFGALSDELLNRRPGPGKWSVGQCLEHLNIIGGHYLPIITQRLQQAKEQGTRPAAVVKSGPIGRRLVESMRQDAVSKPLKTPQKFAPNGSRLSRTVVEVFGRQLDELLSLVEQARTIDMNAVRIPNAIVPLLRLRLPDQLEFLIAHIQRHVAQAERVLQAAARPLSTTKE